MADGVILEKRGIPAAAIITDSFTASANAMARRHGFLDYRYGKVTHPISNLTPEECKARAREAVETVATILGLEARAAAEIPTES